MCLKKTPDLNHSVFLFVLHVELELNLQIKCIQVFRVDLPYVNQGCQIWHKPAIDWHQMGQIRDFLRSDF